jgi:hypothetical protein
LQCLNERHLLSRCRDYETALVIGLRIRYMHEEARAARLISLGCTYQNFPISKNYPYLTPNDRFIGFQLFFIVILRIPFEGFDKENGFELLHGHF